MSPALAAPQESLRIPRRSRSLQRVLAVLVAPFALVMMLASVPVITSGVGSLLHAQPISTPDWLAIALFPCIAVALPWLGWSLWHGQGVPLLLRRAFAVMLFGGPTAWLAWSSFRDSALDEDFCLWVMVLCFSSDAFLALWRTRPAQVEGAEEAG